jgi:hypothetical protein
MPLIAVKQAPLVTERELSCLHPSPVLLDISTTGFKMAWLLFEDMESLTFS